MPSVINLINTGTSANSGNGDSLRTAFNKINQNFLDLENSYIQSGVTSFNGQGGIITFTATDIAGVLGFMPYSDANPENYVTSSTLALVNYAQKSYVDTTFVTTATAANYVTNAYLNGVLTEYPTLTYINAQGFITNLTLPGFLNTYATITFVTDQGYLTSSTVRQYIFSTGDILPRSDITLQLQSDTYNLGSNTVKWANGYFYNSVVINGVPLSANSTTNKLLVNGAPVAGNFTFNAGEIFNNAISFTIGAEASSNAGLTLPSNADGANTSIRLFNTGTSGVSITGKSTTLKVDSAGNTGVAVDGHISLPVLFTDYDGRTGPSNNLRHDYFLIEADDVGSAIINGQTVTNKKPLTLSAKTYAAVQAASNAKTSLLIEGSWVGMCATTASTTSKPMISVYNEGVVIKEYNDNIDAPQFANRGYIFPTMSGSDGQILVCRTSQTIGAMATLNWEEPPTNIDANNAIFTTATIRSSFYLGSGGLTFADSSVMTTAYGNTQVGDFLPTYNGAIGVDYLQGVGTEVNIIAENLKWRFASSGTTNFPNNTIHSGIEPMYIEGREVARLKMQSATTSSTELTSAGVEVTAQGIVFNATSTAYGSINWFFAPNGSLVMPGAIIESVSDASGGTTSSMTTISLAQGIAKLTDGWYTLANGYEGQVLRIVPRQNGTFAGIQIIVSNLRFFAPTLDIRQDALFIPFADYQNNSNPTYNSVRTCIFIDGAWQVDGGYIQ